MASPDSRTVWSLWCSSIHYSTRPTSNSVAVLRLVELYFVFLQELGFHHMLSGRAQRELELDQENNRRKRDQIRTILETPDKDNVKFWRPFRSKIIFVILLNYLCLLKFQEIMRSNPDYFAKKIEAGKQSSQFLTLLDGMVVYNAIAKILY